MNKYSLLLLFFITAGLGQAQQSIEEKLDRQLEYLTKEVRPGCAIGIIKEGKTELMKGFGLANLEHQIPFTPETVSDIGSVAKQMTCMGIILLAQGGKLMLDDPIRKYFPDSPDFAEKITIRHLIHHTSGLREIYGTQAIAGMRPGDAIYQEDAVKLLMQSKELNFEPGSDFSYCNTGYMLLAEIISQVSGQSFEAWMRENIFLPLGMKNTYIMNKPGEVFPNAATSYILGKDTTYTQLYDNSTVQGAGGVYTTIPDLLRWIDNYRSQKLGGYLVREKMEEQGVIKGDKSINYAFGLRKWDFKGMEWIGHTGSSAGYRTLMGYFLKEKFGFVIKQIEQI